MALLEDCLALEAKGQRNEAVRKLTRWIESKGKKPPKELRVKAPDNSSCCYLYIMRGYLVPINIREKSHCIGIC